MNSSFYLTVIMSIDIEITLKLVHTFLSREKKQIMIILIISIKILSLHDKAIHHSPHDLSFLHY